MTLLNRQAAPINDRDSAESGSVEISEGGVTYRGTYRVHAGRGRQRYTVTPDKRVTVAHRDRVKGTSIGRQGLEVIASTLLRELVSEFSAAE